MEPAIQEEGSAATRKLMRRPALAAALTMGLVADGLLRAPGRPGLNVSLWAAVGVLVLVALLQRRDESPSREAMWFIGGALLFATDLAFRDAESLAFFSVFAAMVLLGMAAGRATTTWASRAQVSDVAFSAIRVGVLGAAGPLGWGRGDPDPALRASSWSRTGRTVLRGTLMALPALLVLGALLMSADEVFARLVRDTFQVDLERVTEHVVFTAVIAWGTAGFLRALLVRDDEIMNRLRVPQPALAAAEVSVALWILNALFIAFMAVQLRYLFGGADLVEVTAGLTYAEYARQGFFELVATATLVVPILLVADWAASKQSASSRAVLRGAALVLVVLLVGVIASAAYRMRLYQEAYGLTEDRLYVSVFIVWLTAVLAWLVMTVLRGKRERFAFGSIMAGLGCIAGLYALNPHAVIAKVNLDRAVAGKQYDGNYLHTLSADAVPVILERLPQLPEIERCNATRLLKERWTGERRGGWRTWNLSDWRARRLAAPLKVPSSCPAPPAAEAKSGAPLAVPLLAPPPG